MIEAALKKNWKWFVCYMLMYICIYGPLCMRFGLTVEDAKMVPTSTIWLANGRWLVQIVREIFGHSAHQPVSCLMAGCFISLAIMLQTSIFGLNRRWQKILYGIVYLSCLQWAFIVKYACMCDGVALALLACSVSAYCLAQPPSVKNTTVATLCACLGMAGYQTGAFYLGALLILMIMHKIICREGFHQIRQFSIRAFTACIAGLVMYLIVMKLCKLLVPQDVMDFATDYQNRMISWGSYKSMSLNDCIINYIHWAVVIPLRNILGKGYYLQWIYSTGLVAIMAIFLKSVSGRRYAAAVLLAALGIICMYLPECMTALMPNGWASQGVRLKLAEPVVLAGLWGLFLYQLPAATGGWMRCLCCLGLFLFVKASYKGAMMARDEAYYFNAQMNEMRAMYTLACVEARLANLNSFEVIICGRLKNPPYDHMFPINEYGYYLDEPLPYCFSRKSRIKWFSIYARLPHFRAAEMEEETKYQQKLSNMPSWPKQGCIQIGDSNQILLKIGD